MNDLAIASVTIAACGLILLISSRSRIRRLPAHRLFIASYVVLCVGWTASALDEDLYSGMMDTIEHTSYFVSLIFLSVWTVRSMRVRKTGT